MSSHRTQHIIDIMGDTLGGSAYRDLLSQFYDDLQSIQKQSRAFELQMAYLVQVRKVFANSFGDHGRVTQKQGLHEMIVGASRKQIRMIRQEKYADPRMKRSLVDRLSELKRNSQSDIVEHHQNVHLFTKYTAMLIRSHLSGTSIRSYELEYPKLKHEFIHP